jgi:hypothetical protein
VSAATEQGRRLDALLADLREEDEQRLVAAIRQREAMQALVRRRVTRHRRRRAVQRWLSDLPLACAIWCAGVVARWRAR